MVKKTRGSRKRKYGDFVQGLLKPFDVWQASEGKYRSRCPIHKGDNPSSFRINDWGSWVCFSCGARGEIEHLVMKMQGVTYRQALGLLDKAPSSFTPLMEIPQLPPFEERRGPKLGYEVRREAEIVLFTENCPNYLLERGFSRQALRAWEIGYDVQRCRITIPVRDVLGNLVGVTYRADFPGSLRSRGREIKYWHDHFDKGQHLYGFYKFKGKRLERLFLVEGQLDAVRMHQLGHSAVSVMGSWLDRRQRDLLTKHCKAGHVVLAFDRDEAGRRATRQAIRALIKTRFNRGLQIAYYPTDDPGDLREYHHISYKHWTEVLMKGID